MTTGERLRAVLAMRAGLGAALLAAVNADTASTWSCARHPVQAVDCLLCEAAQLARKVA